MIYITDASYDKESGVSSISFLDKSSGLSKNTQSTLYKNIYEAELFGIKQCLVDAFGKYSNVIVFCDNKQAVFNARREFEKLNLKQRFETSQFVWLPRAFMYEADFLTKNISEIEKNLNLKKIGTGNNVRGNVLTIKLSKTDYDNIIIEKSILIDVSNVILISKLLKEIYYNKVVPERKNLLVMDNEYILDIKNILKNNPSYSIVGSDFQKFLEMLTMFPG